MKKINDNNKNKFGVLRLLPQNILSNEEQSLIKGGHIVIGCFGSGQTLQAVPGLSCEGENKLLYGCHEGATLKK